MSTLRLRLTEVAAQLQQMIDQEYTVGKHRREFKFHPGDAILCLCEGIYYQGEILRFAAGEKRPDLMPPGSVLADDDYVPAYVVLYTGWIEKNEEGIEEVITHEIMENEIIRRAPDGLLNIFGMLFAHEWNVRKCENEQALVCGAWLLGQDEYAALNTAWKELTGETMDFGEYCGRIGL